MPLAGGSGVRCDARGRALNPVLIERATAPAADHAPAQGETPRMSWARLLKRVFDIEHCPNCAGVLKTIAASSDRDTFSKASNRH
jgi:hypothetical protein